jgi:hypothetical protein
MRKYISKHMRKCFLKHIHNRSNITGTEVHHEKMFLKTYT